MISHPSSAHQTYVSNRSLLGVYEYDPAEDGPECEIITRILAKHPLYRVGTEKRALHKSLMLDRASIIAYGRLFKHIGANAQAYVIKRVANYCATKGLA
jgi:hypothetical protein